MAEIPIALFRNKKTGKESALNISDFDRQENGDWVWVCKLPGSIYNLSCHYFIEPMMTVTLSKYEYEKFMSEFDKTEQTRYTVFKKGEIKMIKKDHRILGVEDTLALMEDTKAQLHKKMKEFHRDVILVCEHCGNEQKVSDTELATINTLDHEKRWNHRGYFFHCNECFQYEKNFVTDQDNNWPDYPTIDSFKHYKFSFSEGVICHDRDQNGCLLRFDYFKKMAETEADENF